MDNSLFTPLAFTTVLYGKFTCELSIPWNILPFSFFFYADNLTCHVHRCTHRVKEHFVLTDSRSVCPETVCQTE